jgi:hypothetical protein
VRRVAGQQHLDRAPAGQRALGAGQQRAADALAARRRPHRDQVDVPDRVVPLRARPEHHPGQRTVRDGGEAHSRLLAQPGHDPVRLRGVFRQVQRLAAEVNHIGYVGVGQRDDQKLHGRRH